MIQRLAPAMAVGANRRLRRVLAAFGMFSLTEYGTWLAITVYAFDRGGVGEAGVAAAVQLFPASLVAPVVAYAGDRFRRDRVLATGLGLVGLFGVATGLAMLADAPAALVYFLGALTASSMTITRPSVGAMTPCVTDTVDELTAANAIVELIENAGVFAGPAVGGVLLTTWSPGVAFVALGGGACLAAGAVATAGIDAARMRPTGDLTGSSTRRELRNGFAELRTERGTAATIALIGTAFLVLGAMDVLFVAVALDVLERGEGTAGLLSALSGIGGILGAAASMSLVGARRLRPPIVFAAALGGLPLLLLLDPRTVLVAGVAVIGAGAGTSLLNVAGRTLVQRSTADDVLVRVLGILEGTQQFGLACGSLVIGVVAATAGLDAAIVTVAVSLPFVALVCWPLLAKADASASRIDPESVSIVRSVDFFAPLGAPEISQLALNLHRIRARAGDDIIREGEAGDRFYVILDGDLRVHAKGETLNHRGPGEHVGEIALLFDVPRTATVTATCDTTLVSLGRATFLEAVTGHPAARAGAEQVARNRLG